MEKQSNLFKLNLLLFFICAFSNMNAQIIETKSISCFGLADGQLNIHPTFGVAPYTYLWSNGETSNIAKGLSAGIYSVDVTDASLVTQSFSYTLTEPASLSNSFVVTPNSSWPINNGGFVVTTSGGSGSFNYTLTDSLSLKQTIQNSNTFSSFASGTYYLKTSDLNACLVLDTVRISELASISPVHTIDTTACYGGTATSLVTPDIATMIFPVEVYFDDSLFYTILGYVVDTLSYSDGVTTNPILGISSTSPLYITAIGIVPSGPNAGQDTVMTFAGTFSNTFSPGLHTLKVTTADNKGYRYSWIVDSVDAPITINYTQVNNLCYGDNQGAIISTAQGSYNNYTYNITGPVGFTSVANSSAFGLYAGKYTVTATDSTGCSRSQDINITEGESIRINFETKNAKCPFVPDGDIQVFAYYNATPPVTFVWSTGDTTLQIGSLVPGTYSVTITDANGCSIKDSVSIMAEKPNCLYNIVTPNGDGYNDYLDLSDLCYGVQMEANIFNENGLLVATLDENNPVWDGYNPSNPPTGTSSTYTVFVRLFNNGQTIANIGESFSVIYSK